LGATQVIAGYLPFSETVVPGDISLVEVLNSRLSDSFTKIFTGIVIGKTKEAWAPTVVAGRLGFRAKQLRLQFSVSFLFSVFESHSRPLIRYIALLSRTVSLLLKG